MCPEAAQPALAYWSQEKRKENGDTENLKEMCVGGGELVSYISG